MVYDDLVRDPDEEERPRTPRYWIIPGPNRPRPGEPLEPGPGPELVPPAPREVPPPRAESTTEPAMPSLSQQLREREGTLYGKLNPPQKTGWGRFGQVMGTIGQDVGAAVAPQVMESIPGTTLNRRMELGAVRNMLGEEQQREATREEASKRTEIERQKAGLPKLVSTPGLERRYTDESGVEHMELPIETPGQGIEYREMGPTMLQPQTQPGIPQQPPGTLPRTQAAPPAPTAAPTPAPTQRQYTYGPPKVETAEQALHTRFLDLAAKHQRGEQLNAEEQGIYQDNLGRWGKEVPASDDYLGHLSDRLNERYATTQKLLGRQAPRPPQLVRGESEQVAEGKVADYEKLTAQDMAREQSRLDSLPGKQLQDQLRADQLRMKQEGELTEARVAYGNLYAQQFYRDKMQAWHRSGNYVRDVGLIEDVMNNAKGGGLAASPGMGAAAGALVGGPAGAVAGGAATTFLNLISGPANGYLDALKRQGISNEGYAAMQAYFNALPGRMSYELTTQGLKASAMRSQILLQKVMQTVPGPDTKTEMFNNAFQQYYLPMKKLTDDKYLGRAGFVPPRYEDFYPVETPAATTPGPGKHWNPQKGAYE